MQSEWGSITVRGSCVILVMKSKLYHQSRSSLSWEEIDVKSKKKLLHFLSRYFAVDADIFPRELIWNDSRRHCVWILLMRSSHVQLQNFSQNTAHSNDFLKKKRENVGFVVISDARAPLKTFIGFLMKLVNAG